MLRFLMGTIIPGHRSLSRSSAAECFADLSFARSALRWRPPESESIGDGISTAKTLEAANLPARFGSSGVPTSEDHDPNFADLIGGGSGHVIRGKHSRIGVRRNRSPIFLGGET